MHAAFIYVVLNASVVTGRALTVRTETAERSRRELYFLFAQNAGSPTVMQVRHLYVTPPPATSYKTPQRKGLDTRWAVAHSPKLLQGAMAGVCDYCAFGLALRAFGAAAAAWALLFQVLSWFNFYCLVRPYSNSAEAVLATAALFHWAPHILSARRKSARGDGGGGGGGSRDWGAAAVGSRDSKGTRGETCALLLAALCVAVRPTSAALWVSFLVLLVRCLPRSLRVSLCVPEEEAGCRFSCKLLARAFSQSHSAAPSLLYLHLDKFDLL